MNRSQSTLRLTQEQSDAIEAAFGEHVSELPFTVEEFSLAGSNSDKMKVLKIDNIAKVQSAELGGRSIVN